LPPSVNVMILSDFWASISHAVDITFSGDMDPSVSILNMNLSCWPSTVMASASQSLTQVLHMLHSSGSTTNILFSSSSNLRTPLGHSSAHFPQASHFSVSMVIKG